MRQSVFDRRGDVSRCDGPKWVSYHLDTFKIRVSTEFVSQQCVMELIGAAISDNAVSTRQASHQCEIQSILREDIDV